METVRVIARPRIHIGLVDLSGVSLRKYGGVGFALDGPATIWRVQHADSTVLDGTQRLDLNARRDLAQLKGRLDAICHNGCYRATLEQVAEQHIGLGTKTTLSMALIAAVNYLKELALDAGSITSLSGRGGASGVGVNLFFNGGVVWDGGHPRDAGTPFLPSSASHPLDNPPLLARWDFPSNWQIVLMLPSGTSASGEYEQEFFRRNTPIPTIEALETMSLMYHGIIPAIATRDLDTLRRALSELHKVGFKERELKAQSVQVKAMLRYVQGFEGIAVGMSSMGPLLYAIVSKADSASILRLKHVCATHDATFLDVADAWNLGHEHIQS